MEPHASNGKKARKEVDSGNDVRDTAKRSPAHRRSISGNLLAKISFLRPSEENPPPQLKDGTAQLDAPSPSTTNGEKPKSGGALASALQEKKTRRRKGSLRKTAILGTGRLRMEAKDNNKKTPHLEPLIPVDKSTAPPLATTELSTSPDEMATPRPSLDRSPASTDSTTTISTAPGTESGFSSKVSVNDVTSDEHLPLLPARARNKPTFGDLSTTDDDDAALTYMRPPNGSSMALKKPTANVDSYFPADALGIPRRRSAAARAKSPLATLPLEPATPSAEEWDYADTEWWGWVVLIVTWVVFVVGMGSCLGVWSWAWDVGETPYAPPELEDDPTLPIVGYYPALIILTAVMAWVWVVVAWVGMKYFKHAKISGEDV